MSNYRKPAFAGARDEDTREDLESILAELAERDAPASAEVINALLEQRREIKARAKLAAELKLQENREFMDTLKDQHREMLAALKRFGFDVIGYEGHPAPDLNEVYGEMKSEHLLLARKLSVPTLLLIPPRHGAGMVRRIDRHRLPSQKKCTYPRKWWSDNFFNNFKDDKSGVGNKWGIAIAEGKTDQAVFDTNFEFIRTSAESAFWDWKVTLKENGLEVMDSARAWLTLWMARVQSMGEYIDHRGSTVLVQREGELIAAKWENDHIRFAGDHGYSDSNGLSARGIIWVRKQD